MKYEDLSPELMEKAKTCKTADDLLELAKEEGVDLTDEQLAAVAGGESNWDKQMGCNDQFCLGNED